MDFFYQADDESNKTDINLSRMSINTEMKMTMTIKKEQERKNKIEQYLIFDIENNNSPPNKEN